MIDRYAWRGGDEAMLRFGPASGVVVLVAMPLFEEANRMRAFVGAVCRGLAARGVASAVPDLPGTGESLVETEEASLTDWRAAFAAAAATFAGRRVIALGLRGGCLLDVDTAVERYHVAPVAGVKLVRDLVRTRLAAAKESGEVFEAGAIAPPGPPIELAGNFLARELLAALQVAEPVAAARVVRLASDPAAADLHIDAAPLWRRAEPGQDQAFADRLVDDLCGWIGA